MAEPLDFIPYPWDDHYEEIIAIHEHIEADRLPFDTLFRLAGIGYALRDPEDESKWLRWQLLQDFIKNADDWERFRPDTRALLEDPLPDAITAAGSQAGKPYRDLDPMYYTLGNLTRVIREDRGGQGKTVQETPPKSYCTFEEFEWSRCVGLARPIWRTIIQRIHLEWLKYPESYFPNTTRSFFTTYELSTSTVRRRLIGSAVISDAVVYDIHEEAERTGVRNIGPQGKESLRRLLEDEHLELSRDALVVALRS